LAILQKVLLRLSEHGGVTETQTIKFVPPQSFLANSVPASVYDDANTCVET